MGIDSQRIKLRASDVMAKCPIYGGGDVVGGRMSPPVCYLPSCPRWLAFVTARDQDGLVDGVLEIFKIFDVAVYEE